MPTNKLAPLLATALLAAALAIAAPLASAHSAVKPQIKDSEVGYFGGATVTYKLSVFVYSNLGPRAGNHVTVCLNGKCERAIGHNAALAWYRADFSTRGLKMGDMVHYSATASDAAGQASTSVTKPLLCLWNNGSTPQG